MAAINPDKESLNCSLTIRVYGKAKDCSDGHSYLVGDSFSDVSHPIGKLIIDIRAVTLQQLRPMIEYDRSNRMDKRSMMFQEAIFLMDRLPNEHGRPRHELREYRFGFIKKDFSDIRMVHPNEETKYISEFFSPTDFFLHDLCIVPLTQIDPTSET
jgi:hypothetical protein